MLRLSAIVMMLVLACSAAIAGTTTTHYSLYKPAVSETGWGAAVSANMDTIDARMKLNADGLGNANSDSTWTLHNSYPAACASGQYVTAIGDTLTCAAAVAAETDPQVGSVTNNKWCIGDGSAVQCSQDAPTSAVWGAITGSVAAQTDLAIYALDTDLTVYALATSLANYYTKVEIDGAAYLTAESDPVWLAQKGDYVTEVEASVYAQASALSNYIPKTDGALYAQASALSSYALLAGAHFTGAVQTDNSLYVGTTAPSNSQVSMASAGDAMFGGDVEIDRTLYVDGALYMAGATVIVPKGVTADPCALQPEGSLFYNSTGKYWCTCNGSGVDVIIYAPTSACY